ncbi:enoyl-CoA hydratase/isomerase family protein [Kutzneria sp. NPDC052558]|uniref:enoyl-CoA hydratase/isomerase family protein n=1 Tax=Kutzneria sp. NPDC052558 TaxID=3364121 RepID=UPI0037C6134D
MTVDDAVRTIRKPGHLVVLLNDDRVGNALTPELVDRLHRALDEAEADPACRAVVLTAVGETFCAGSALRKLDAEGFGAMATGLWRLLCRLAGGRLPTVAVMEGWATGGGVGLAAACDVVIASPSVTCQLTEVYFGMLPTIIMPWIARRVGEHRALRMAMLADRLTAAEAHRVGLIDVLDESPTTALRRVLAAVRRSDRDTLGDLKDVHRVLFPPDERYGLLAERTFGARLNDPKVANRIRALVKEGLL